MPITEADLNRHEADLDARISDRTPVRYKAARPELVWRRADPTQEFGGHATVPAEYRADKLTLQGVEVHRMPARPAPKPREPLLSPAGRFWVPYVITAALLGVWWALVA